MQKKEKNKKMMKIFFIDRIIFLKKNIFKKIQGYRMDNPNEIRKS